MNLVSVTKEISHITMIDSSYTLLSRMRMYVTYLIPFAFAYHEYSNTLSAAV